MSALQCVLEQLAHMCAFRDGEIVRERTGSRSKVLLPPLTLANAQLPLESLGADTAPSEAFGIDVIAVKPKLHSLHPPRPLAWLRSLPLLAVFIVTDR